MYVNISLSAKLLVFPDEDSAESSSRAPPQRIESSETITSSPQRMVSSETIRSSELDGEVLDGEEIDELINRNEEQRGT